jgi:NAD(P)-dependent dehydrogenase (short-subunit alcohol dehydrogenase family)
VLTINFKAAFMLMKAVIPTMIKQNKGVIVNNTSNLAFVAKPRAAIYGPSKAALVQLTKSAAIDWASYNIRVNAVAPANTNTAMLQQVLQELPTRYPDLFDREHIEVDYKSSIPLGRFSEPSEIAWVIAFLASEAASFISGAVVPVDGGLSAQ